MIEVAPLTGPLAWNRKPAALAGGLSFVIDRQWVQSRSSLTTWKCHMANWLSESPQPGTTLWAARQIERLLAEEEEKKRRNSGAGTLPRLVRSNSHKLPLNQHGLYIRRFLLKAPARQDIRTRSASSAIGCGCVWAHISPSRHRRRRTFKRNATGNQRRTKLFAGSSKMRLCDSGVGRACRTDTGRVRLRSHCPT